MALTRYPLLDSLLTDLTRLATNESAAKAEDARKGITTREGKDVSRVTIPWAGSFLLSGAQREVVRFLIEAHGEGGGDVTEARLLRVAGGSSRRLADLFSGHPAWGTLIVAGSRAGCYRLVPPPVADQDEEPRIVRDE